jgi:phosphoribosylformimino-5-aminoimidazole carboxamide ribotide isomerase
MIVPCIDLMNGKAVQLVRGEKKVIEIDRPLDLVDRFAGFPVLNVIDLDAAMGKGNNREVIGQLCAKTRCRVGGGIRSVEYAAQVIEFGADQLIVGTSAFSSDGINESFLSRLKDTVGKEKVVIALDTKKGDIAIKGWKESLSIQVEDVIQKLEPFCSGFLCTYIDKEGMMEGTDLSWFEKLRGMTTLPITAAGGISTYEEIEALDRMRIDVAIGMAIYTEKFDLERLREMNNQTKK